MRKIEMKQLYLQTGIIIFEDVRLAKIAGHLKRRIFR